MSETEATNAIEYQILLKGYPYTNFWPWDWGKWVYYRTETTKEDAESAGQFFAGRGHKVKVVPVSYNPKARKEAMLSRIHWEAEKSSKEKASNPPQGRREY